MAKKRLLKKNISDIASELLDLAAMRCCLDADGKVEEKMKMVIGRIVEMEDTFVRRAQHPDAKDNKVLVKKYYNKLLADFHDEAVAINKEIAESYDELGEK